MYDKAMDKEPPKDDDQRVSGADLAADLAAMNEEVDVEYSEGDREEAWQQYKGYDSMEYQAANAERAATGKIMIDLYPGATIVAQINLDGDGHAIDGHDYNSDSQSHRDTEAAFAEYLERTKNHPEARLVLLEGDVQTLPGGRTEAIQARADAGLAMWLADGQGIDKTTADPSREEVIAYLDQQGVDRVEQTLANTVSSLIVSLEQNPNTDLAMVVYGQLALNGVEGFKLFSPEEQAKIADTPGAIEELKAQAGKVITEQFNPLLANQDGPQFTVDEDGQYRLPGSTPESIWTLTGPDGEGRLGDIFRMKLAFRDKHIFETITGAVEAGKEPFMVFGGSHVVALEPSLATYFGTPPQRSFGA